MNISHNWLRALAPSVTDTPEVLKERLAKLGAPADAVTRVGGGLENIVIARVQKADRHPNADRLSLCEVDAGTGEILSVVCGAPNVRTGGYYPFAPAGTVMPDGKEIRRAKIRGAESRGMLCSERELGLGREHDGIMELPPVFEPGTPFVQALELEDVRFELDIGANRPDLLSHIGIAREVAEGGVAGVTLAPFPGARTDNALQLSSVREGEIDGVRIRIDDATGCPRYMAAVIRGVRIQPSPTWLAARLRAVGLRPINNVVDATNYILHELGQPMHAFDRDRIGGNAIIVRRAHEGETLTTLDGSERKLDTSMLMIADAERATAVAGVMGGQDSEVTADTTNVLLECALFEPKSVRATRRKLGLSTDASYRFERGVDYDGMERSLRRAVDLIVAVAGGEPVSELLDVIAEPRSARTVAVRTARVTQLLGIPFTTETIAAMLEPIGFSAMEQSAERTLFRVPGWRSYDVEREVDLIEEVARRHGYDNFPDALHAFRPSAVPDDPMFALERRLRTLLVGRGFLEARTAAFAPEAEGDVSLENPLAAPEGMLRRALGPGLLHRVEYNFARGTRNVRLFEIGTGFAPSSDPEGRPAETTRIALAFTGARAPAHWSAPSADYDEWDLKGLLEELASVLGGRVEPGAAPNTPVPAGAGVGFTVTSRDGAIGYAGRVADSAIDAPPWAAPVWLAELILSPSMSTDEPVQIQATPAFPGIDRDMALLVPNELTAQNVEDVIRKAGGALLERITIFDVYRGKGIPANMRSIAFRTEFRAPDRTLTDEEADRTLNNILRRLKEELGVERRG